MERMLAGMLTRKPVRLLDVPDTIEEQLFNVDLEGNNLTNFVYNISRLCIRYGHVGVLVDAPANGGQTLLDPLHPKRHNWLAYRGKRWTKGINSAKTYGTHCKTQR